MQKSFLETVEDAMRAAQDADPVRELLSRSPAVLTAADVDALVEAAAACGPPPQTAVGVPRHARAERRAPAAHTLQQMVDAASVPVQTPTPGSGSLLGPVTASAPWVWEVINADADNDPTLDRIGGLLDALAERSIARQGDREAAEAEEKRRVHARQQVQEVLAARRHREAEARAAEDARQLDALTAKLLDR